MNNVISLFNHNVEDHMGDLRDVFGRMCANAGYTFSIKINPHSAGHRFIIRIFDGETVVYQSKKVRTYVRRNPLTLEPRTANSPRIADLKENINRRLEMMNRPILRPPARTEPEYLKWLLAS